MRSISIAALLIGITALLIGCTNKGTDADKNAGNGKPTTAESFVLSGDFTDMYVTGKVVVFEDYHGDKPNAIVTAELADGRFKVEGKIDTPKRVFYYVEDGIGPNGEKWAPIKGQMFILEPGEVELTYTSKDHTTASGHYNDIVVGSWKNSEAYRKVLDDFSAAIKESGDENLSEEERKSVNRRISEGQSAKIELENDGLKEVVINHDDPMASLLAIQMLRYGGGPWVVERMIELVEVYPDNVWLKNSIVEAETRKLKTDKAHSIAVGTSILDFEAENLSGENVKLIDVRKKSKYVLVEFWASWCGPCRKEIPHLKKAYSTYGPQGFEIFSFSFDDEREAWEDASADEELPWINTSDLLGFDSSVAEQYGVTGVPANYLVESVTGEIVAKNLRGDDLDEKLSELFKETTAAPMMMAPIK